MLPSLFLQPVRCDDSSAPTADVFALPAFPGPGCTAGLYFASAAGCVPGAHTFLCAFGRLHTSTEMYWLSKLSSCTLLCCLSAVPLPSCQAARCLKFAVYLDLFACESTQASCALEFELDLVRVYMDMESAKIPSLQEETAGEGDSTGGAAREHVAQRLGRKEALQAFVSTLLSAACRAKRQACRQDRERVIRDAGFDSTLSSKWVVVSEGGQLVSSAADNGHSHSLVHQCLRRGTWSWELALERESSGDETTCVGVAVNPVTNSCYEDSHQVINLDHPFDSVHSFLYRDHGSLFAVQM